MKQWRIWIRGKLLILPLLLQPVVGKCHTAWAGGKGKVEGNP